MISNQELIQKAHSVLHLRQPSNEVTTGEVSAALVTEQGNVYLGVSISASCGIGFCAEHRQLSAALRTLPRIDLRGQPRQPEHGGLALRGEDGPACAAAARTLAGVVERFMIQALTIIIPFGIILGYG
jgi:hypothetical protein